MPPRARSTVRRPLALAAALAVLGPCSVVLAQADDAAPATGEAALPDLSPGTFGALRARGIGPAVNSGRISDIAVHPDDHATWIVTTASGGVWRTTDNGVTFDPVFDGQGSYSIGCVTYDPSNPHTVWVGTGENNAQRSVSWGDGVYRSNDGGRSWTNMGLKESEHIGMIAVHPEDSDTVFVASQGPLWRPGGDRGLYKTTDGGTSWRRVLHVDEHTGVNEVHLDPRDPDVMYASTYQRARKVWTMINGGPGSGIFKSTDGGETWRELTRGLPGGDKGKIGLDIAPASPDVIYAIVEAKDGQGGFYRSENRGESWRRMSGYSSSAPMYYHEIVCDPYEVDRVYMMDTMLGVTEDGGRTWDRIQGRSVHVDNHALWIDPDDTRHLVVGNDGGVYESWNRGRTWQYKPNLPITQFYRVSLDNSEPFYMVYGGTQDNNTLGGPSRTTRREGITNEDWFVTVGGDGFETQVDPEDPNLVYSQWQYGGLVRYDRLTGETTDIKPRPEPGDPPHVFNWDAPLLISPHSNTRLYFGGRRLYRSEDRGDSWTAISGDLSRGIDRNELEIMGKVWPVDAVAKHRSTSIYGNTVALSESPLVEDLLYVGTDDGLIHVSEDGGGAWRTVDAVPFVPHKTYVSCLTASQHDADTVYATFDNHKEGDFTPYVLVSRDRGRTWENIAGNLPEHDVCYSIAEDHVRDSLLFVGTEFGAYYTIDGGGEWLKVRGLPTIAVRDVDVQRRENDLAFATFGRGFYIVDDYSPLQHVTKADTEKDAHVFPIRDALFYVPGSKGRGSQGDSFYRASNPPFGAMITWHLKDSVRTGPRMDSNATKPEYDKLREQERTRRPAVWLTIRTEDGDTVARLNGSTSAGVHRTTWNLRYSGGGFGGGPYVLPGTYTVQVHRQKDGETVALTDEVPFTVKHLAAGTLQPEDRAAVLAFHREVVELSQAVNAASRTISEARGQLDGVESAVEDTLDADPALALPAHDLRVRLDELAEAIDGDGLPARFQEPTIPGIRERVGYATASWRMTAPPTETQRKAFEYAEAELVPVMEQLRTLLADIAAYQAELDAAGVRWTPGRVPTWGLD